MNFLQQYEHALAQKQIEDDAHQRRVLPSLQRMYDELLKPKPWYARFCSRDESILGLYIVGPVGAGKTWLMDLFYNSLPASMVYRVHFHAFMQSVDVQLRRWQGHSDPLKVIAKRLSRHIKVLCLDEFIVQDITQARVWVALLSELLSYKVVLVATSNTHPDDLYNQGINREQFLPAIGLIKKHCEIIEMRSNLDHRLQFEQNDLEFWFGTDPISIQKFERIFYKLEPFANGLGMINIQNRLIQYQACGERAIWFEFNDLCQIPRCQLDYLELAHKFDKIFISHVPTLLEDNGVGAILFMYLVDVLYDKKCCLFISSDLEIDQLYPNGPMKSAFVRTESRLMEMRSAHYCTNLS